MKCAVGGFIKVFHFIETDAARIARGISHSHEHEYECAGIEMSRFIHSQTADEIAQSMYIDIFIYLRFMFPLSKCVMRLRRSCIGLVVSLSLTPSLFMYVVVAV